MFVPLHDAPPLSEKNPWATWTLAALLLAVQILIAAGPGTAAERGARALALGFVPAAPAPPAWVTHLLVHATWLHLAGNLLFLLVLGPNVERALGAPLFVGAWLLCGVAGALAFWAQDPSTTEVLVGASGAGLGLAGVHVVAFRGHRIRLLVWIFFVWLGDVPARPFLLLLVALDLAALFLGAYGGTRVAVAAHLGGFACGALLGLAVGLAARGRIRQASSAANAATRESPARMSSSEQA